MSEHLKSLAVIIGLAALVFTLVKQPACAIATTASDFTRRRNLWFAITLTAFLAHNFWIYIIVAGALLLVMARRETNKVALFFSLLFAVPLFQAEISGLGVIKHFFAINHFRLLSLTILLPAFLALRKRATTEASKPDRADLILAAYLILSLMLQLNVDSFTNTLRFGFYTVLDVVLPYYVVSRSLKDMQSFREVLMSLVVAGMVLAAIGMFEFGRHWLLYSSLDDALGVSEGFGSYLEREGSLRALATTGQPIVLGYVMAVVLGFYLFLQKSVPSRAVWLFGLGLLLAGLLAPLSRGPWLGAAVILLIFVVTGPRAFSRVFTIVLVGLLALPILLATPFGEQIIDYLPFVGTVDEENVTYRQRLIEVSLNIIQANPFFGSYDFLLYLEELRQGQGIIDLVNSYLAIALASGLVGLALFLGFFGVILINIHKAMRRLDMTDDRHLLGRVLLSTIIGILVMIFTVSSISVIPLIYWTVGGLGIAYIRMANQLPPLQQEHPT